LESLLDPGTVVLQIESRISHQEVARAEPGERLHPGGVPAQIALELVDVARPGSHDTPAEDADARAVRCHRRLLRRAFYHRAGEGLGDGILAPDERAGGCGARPRARRHDGRRRAAPGLRAVRLDRGAALRELPGRLASASEAPAPARRRGVRLRAAGG